MSEFGRELARLMDARGTGVRELARQVPCNPGHISNLRNSRGRPSPQLAARLDDVLDAGGDLARLAGVTAAATFRGPVAPELVGYFSSQLAGHYSADRFLGPTRLIPTVVSQYELLCDLANAAAGSLRSDLWSIATGYAAFIGWLHQDAGDLQMSAHWHDVMIERAHRAHDTQLVAFALHNKAMLLVDMGDGPGALDLTGAALGQYGPRLCAKVQVLLLQQAAHATSLVGGDGAVGMCEQLIDQAAALVGAIDDSYPWGGNALTPRYLDVQRATISTRLGRTREALGLWDQIVPDIPASSRRDLGVYRARQAQALAEAGEPEQAVAIAADVVPLVAQTGSARMRAELSALRRRMEPWSGQPEGRALKELLSGMPARLGGGKWRRGIR